MNRIIEAAEALFDALDAKDRDEVRVMSAAVALLSAVQALRDGGAEPVAFDHSIGADRFKVVKGSFWWHIRIGDSTGNVGKFHSKMAAEDVALKLLTAFRDGAYLQHQAMLATPPTQGAPALTVRLCSFPESNGKRNWTAMLVRKTPWGGLVGNCGGITIAHGELWNRVAYEAECARALIGERDTEPHILDYGDDIHTPEEWAGEKHGGRPIRATPTSAPPAEPAAAPGVGAARWEGAEEWMPLAWALCADEHGEEACTELIWEGGAIPEPWGDRWLKYEGEAKRLIALVREHVPALAAASAPRVAVQFWTTMAHIDAAKAGKSLHVSERQGVEFCVPVHFGKPQPADDFRD